MVLLVIFLVFIAAIYIQLFLSSASAHLSNTRMTLNTCTFDATYHVNMIYIIIYIDQC